MVTKKANSGCTEKTEASPRKRRSRAMIEETLPAGKKADQFQQMDGAESSYFKKA